MLISPYVGVINAQNKSTVVSYAGDYTHLFRLSRATETTYVGEATWDVIGEDVGLGLTGPLSRVTVPAGVNLANLTFRSRSSNADGTNYFDSRIYVDASIVSRSVYHDSRYSTFILNAWVPVTPGQEVYCGIYDGSGTDLSSNSSFSGVFYG